MCLNTIVLVNNECLIFSQGSRSLALDLQAVTWCSRSKALDLSIYRSPYFNIALLELSMQRHKYIKFPLFVQL